MILVAITGSICSGKSFVSKIIEELGYTVFSCDDEIRKILKEKAVLKRIYSSLRAQRSNPSYLQRAAKVDCRAALAMTSAGVNKKLLAEIIFNDSKARAKLEEILYPKLFARQDKFIAKLKKLDSKIGFFEVPLLYEKKLESIYNCVIVTHAPKSILIKRAIERKIDQKIFSNILRIQMPSSEKKRMADYIVNTNVQALELEKKIKKIIGEILKCQKER